MDGVVFVVMVVVVLGALFTLYAIAIGGSVDALGQPREVWERAGLRRGHWIWQAAAVLFPVAALAYSGVYFARIRPRLLAAARDIAIEQCAARGHSVAARPAAGLPGNAITIRTAPSVAFTYALTLGLAQIVGGALAVLLEGRGAPVPWGRFMIPLVTALVVVLPMVWTFGVTLTLDVLVVRGLTRRRIAWCDVVAIEPRSQLGSRSVRLWTRTGGARRLRAPLTFLGVGRQRFADDVAVLEQWWSTHTLATG